MKITQVTIRANLMVAQFHSIHLELTAQLQSGDTVTESVSALADEVSDQLKRLRDGDPVPALPPSHRKPLRELLALEFRD